MDYRELLKKYMRHIEESEGAFYLGNIVPGDIFTSDEAIALDRIAEEIDRERIDNGLNSTG